MESDKRDLSGYNKIRLTILTCRFYAACPLNIWQTEQFFITSPVTGDISRGRYARESRALPRNRMRNILAG